MQLESHLAQPPDYPQPNFSNNAIMLATPDLFAPLLCSHVLSVHRISTRKSHSQNACNRSLVTVLAPAPRIRRPPQHLTHQGKPPNCLPFSPNPRLFCLPCLPRPHDCLTSSTILTNDPHHSCNASSVSIHYLNHLAHKRQAHLEAAEYSGEHLGLNLAESQAISHPLQQRLDLEAQLDESPNLSPLYRSDSVKVREVRLPDRTLAARYTGQGEPHKSRSTPPTPFSMRSKLYEVIRKVG